MAIQDKHINQFNQATKKLGTVFEILGDFYHSNLWFYNSEDLSEKKIGLEQKQLTHDENYEYTMHRLKHIEILDSECSMFGLQILENLLKSRTRTKMSRCLVSTAKANISI